MFMQRGGGEEGRKESGIWTVITKEGNEAQVLTLIGVLFKKAKYLWVSRHDTHSIFYKEKCFGWDVSKKLQAQAM